MTNHAKDAAEKIGQLFPGMPSIVGRAVQSAIDAATAPLREEIERLKLEITMYDAQQERDAAIRDEAYERAARVAEDWHYPPINTASGIATFKVGDEVSWEDDAGNGPGEIEWPAKIEWLSDTQALVRFGDGMLGIIPLSELRPAPVKL